jgi:hypothetical protein
MRPASLALLLMLGAAAPLSAQAGYPPDASPYKPITKSLSVTALGGYIGGSGGILGVGPHDGPVYGGRFGISVSGPVEFGFAVQYADLQGRLVKADPLGKLYLSNLVPEPIWLTEFTTQFTLTGGKTWHHLAPYIGGGLGYAWRAYTPQSANAFSFGGRFYLVPFVGTRVFVNDRAFLRAEIRGAFWKLAYPPPYYVDYYGLLQSYAYNNYLSNVWYQFGVGYSF